MLVREGVSQEWFSFNFWASTGKVCVSKCLCMRTVLHWIAVPLIWTTSSEHKTTTDVSDIGVTGKICASAMLGFP